MEHEHSGAPLAPPAPPGHRPGHQVTTAFNDHEIPSSLQPLTITRCFLRGGGSTESFFVREDLAIGAEIGTLRVIGDPKKDIRLSLEGEPGGPIQLGQGVNGSSVLVLAGPLDREGVEGAGGVASTLACTPRGTTEPGYTIPVSVRSVTWPITFVQVSFRVHVMSVSYDSCVPILIF